MMTKRYAFVLALTAATWGLAPLAQAQQPMQKEPSAAVMAKVDEVFKTLDKGGKGYLDREDAKGEPQIDKNFTQINTSGSGKITKEELATWLAARK